MTTIDLSNPSQSSSLTDSQPTLPRSRPRSKSLNHALHQHPSRSNVQLPQHTPPDEACFVDPPFRSPLSTPTQSSPSKSSHFARRLSSFHLSSSLLSAQLLRSPALRPKPKPAAPIDFLTQLPVELALYVLLKLGDPQSLLRARLVSTAWRRLAEDPVVWRELFLAHKHWNVKRHFPAPPSPSRAPRQIPPPLAGVDEHPQTSPTAPDVPLLPNLSRQNDIESYRAHGSGNRHTARRLSQLLDLDLLPPPAPPLSTEPLTDAPSPLPALDWLQMYRDRAVLEARWAAGTQRRRTLKGHKDSVYCLELDGNRIVTGSRDRTVRVWDKDSGVCVQSLRGHKGSVLCVRLVDGLLLTGSSDCTVLEWELATGLVRRRLVGHTSGVLDIALDDRLVASGSKDTTVRVWTRAGAHVRTLAGHSGPVNALALAGDGKLLSASGDGSMKLWEPLEGSLVRTFTGHLRGLATIKVVDDGRRVVSGSNDETIKVWDIATGQCLQTLLGHEGLVRSLDVDISQRRLVSGSYDKTIKVWDLETGQLKLDFRKGERSLVFDVKIGIGEIILVGHDSNVMILDFSYGINCENFC